MIKIAWYWEFGLGWQKVMCCCHSRAQDPLAAKVQFLVICLHRATKRLQGIRLKRVQPLQGLGQTSWQIKVLRLGFCQYCQLLQASQRQDSTMADLGHCQPKYALIYLAQTPDQSHLWRAVEIHQGSLGWKNLLPGSAATVAYERS